MATKSTKKVTKKAVAKKPVKTRQTAKTLAAKKSIKKKPVQVTLAGHTLETEPLKPVDVSDALLTPEQMAEVKAMVEIAPPQFISASNTESKVAVSTTTVDKLTFNSLIDKEHSISPEQAEKIAESRVTHEDERPPNSNLTIPELAARAWDEVRGADPPLSACVQSHVEKYLSHAQVILKGSCPLGGSTRLALFEQAVARLMREN